MTNREFTSRQVALLVLISTVGILLRFAEIDRSHWVDDVANWKTVVQIASHDNQPPLYDSTLFA